MAGEGDPAHLVQNDEGVLEGEVIEARRDVGRNRVPGVAVAVVRDGELVSAKGFGVRALGHEGGVDADTVFGVASNTKAFTAALLGTLVDEKKLSWDDRVVDHLPSFALSDPWVTRDIRVRDLLCHRSGLPTFGGDHLWIGVCQPSETILSRLRHLEPTTSFRTRFQYQNLMFLAAGKVAESVAQESWAELMRARLLEPLDMTRSRTSIHDLAALQNVAQPHERRVEAITVVPFDDVDCIAPAGALNASTRDMGQWMLLNLEAGKRGDTQILSAAVIHEMQTVQTPRPVSPNRAARYGAHFSGYGLGWGLTDYHGVKLVQHGGGLTGMISLQTLVPEKQLGILVLTNLAPNSLCGAITYRILDAFLGRPAHDWSATFLADRQRGEEQSEQRRAALLASRIPDTLPSGPPADFVGTYHQPFSGETRVYLDGKQLVFDYNPRHRGPLEHWHHNTFRVVWDDPIFDMPPASFVTFQREASGPIGSLVVTFYHPITFQRRVSDHE